MKYKKLLSAILSTSMLLSMIPIVANAEEDTTDNASEIQTETEFLYDDNSQAENIISEYIESKDDISLYSAEDIDEESTYPFLTLEAYDTMLGGMEEAADYDYDALSEDPDYIKLVLQRRLVEKTNYSRLVSEAEANPDFLECMEWLFNDYEMLCNYIYGGEPEANGHRQKGNKPTPPVYVRSLRVLTKLYAKHKDDIANGEENAALFKRIMAAVALTHSVSVSYWYIRSPSPATNFNWYKESEPVGRYELYKKFYLHDLLVDDFATYNVEQLRMVVSAPLDNTELEWLHYYYRVKRKGNTDYANNPIKFKVGSIPCASSLIRYTTFNYRPNKFGGLGDKYYDPANYDMWNSKYGLSVHDDYGIFDYDVDYGPNSKGQYYAAQWLCFECGTVCYGISFTSVVLRQAFGIPAIYFGQPGHSAYFNYYYASDKRVLWSIGYNIYNIKQSTVHDDGQTYTVAGWGNRDYASFYNASYLIPATDAITNTYNTDYEKAQSFVMMGNIKYEHGDYEAAEGLYEKALDAQFYNLDAWDGLGRAILAQNKTDEEIYEFCERVAEGLKWYPLPMYDYLNNFIMPNITSIAVRSDILALINNTLNIAAGANANNCYLAQPSYTSQMGSYLKGIVKKIAGFSFNNGAFTLNSEYAAADVDVYYSMDGGNTWSTWIREAGDSKLVFTDAEIASITDANNILYRIEGASSIHRIEITTAARPVSDLKQNTPEDNEDRFLNIASGIEWSTDEGATWHNLTSESIFEGDITVWLRVKASGTARESAHIEVVFTQGEGTPERSYLKMKNMVTLMTYPTSMSGSPAQNAFDGKVNTMWVSMWSNTSQSMAKDEQGQWKPRQNYEFICMLKDPKFISAISYLPGDVEGAIKGLDVYTSMDGNIWQLAGSVSNWTADLSEKAIEFSEPAYTKYIKLVTTKTGTKYFNLIGMDVGYATAAEFKFFENYACHDKTIDSLELIMNESCKTSYKVGDALKLDGISARVIYDDNTTALVPATELDYSVDIFKSTQIDQVEVEYKGVRASYNVTVLPNDRTATAIVSATPKDRRYFAGDAFDANDLQVIVTDGTDNWYLMSDEINIEGMIIEGNQTLTARHNGLSRDFQITASKAVQSMKINTDDDSFKAQYSLGESMDLNGMDVVLVYKDGSEEAISEADYTLTVHDIYDRKIETEDFSKTPGSKTLKAVLNNKADIKNEIDLTVFPYISSGEFEFEAADGEYTCNLTAYVPRGSLEGKTVSIPETVTVGSTVYTVTGISTGAFNAATDVEAVSLPRTISLIESHAFAGCYDLKKIYMIYHESLEEFECSSTAVESQYEDGTPITESRYVYLHHSLAGSPSPIIGFETADITQNAVSMELIQPHKLNYILNERFDTTGMTVSVNLNDGSKVDTKNYTLSGYNSSVVGEQTVTVNVNGTSLTKTFTVTVEFPTVSIIKSPKNAAYSANVVPEPLVTEAIAENNHVSYQWYRSETEEFAGTAIEGATEASYIPNESGYYYARAYIKDEENNESESVYSDIARVLISDYEAIVGTIGYNTLSEAVAAAPDKSTVMLCKDIALSAQIAYTGKAITLDGCGYTVSRGNGYTGAFFSLSSAAELTVKNVTFDGGAVWTGEEDPILKRGTINTGIFAMAPFIIALSGTKLSLMTGTVMQNNCNNYRSTKVQYTGGTVYGDSTNVLVDGAVMRNNSSKIFGSALYLRGSSTMTIVDCIIEGNSDPLPTSDFNASAICLDNTSKGEVGGGIFRNNLGGLQGGVFWVGNGSLKISGGTYENNSAGEGAVVFIYANTTEKIPLSINGGIYRGNKATTNGGAIWAPKDLSIGSGSFENNSAKNGGAIWTKANLTIGGGNFEGNTAEKGAAVYFDEERTLTLLSFVNLQEVYFKTFKKILLNGSGVAGKNLYIKTDSAVTDGMVVADMPANYRMGGTINDLDLKVESEQNVYKLIAREAKDIKIEKENDSINVNVRNDIAALGGKLVIAAYDASGAMVGLSVSDVEGVKNYELNRNDIHAVKAFVWDGLNGMKPQTSVAKIEINN